MLSLISLGLVAFGAANCFFGLKIHRIILAAWGFIVGALIAGILSQNNLIIMLIVGIIGAYYQVVSYKMGIFMTGSLLGIIVVWWLLTILGVQSWIILLLFWILVTLFTGGIALKLEKFIIILSSSFGGALAIIVGFLLLVSPQIYGPLGLLVIGSIPFVGILALLGIGISGVIFQFGGPTKIRNQYEAVIKQIKDYQEKRSSGMSQDLKIIATNIMHSILSEIDNMEPHKSSAGWITGVLAILLLVFAALFLNQGSLYAIPAFCAVMIGDLLLLRFINFRIDANQTKIRVAEEAGRYGKLGKL